MFIVYVKADETEFVTSVEDTDIVWCDYDSIGGAVGMALRALAFPRIEQVLAGAINLVRELGCFEPVDEAWVGYKAALDKLCDAARELSSGWMKHDRSLLVREKHE